MSEISNIGITNSYAATYRSPLPSTSPAGEHGGAADSDAEVDRVEFSRMGQLLAGAVETSSLRRAKIQAIRAQIAEGTYETPERIQGAIDRLIEVIG